MSRTGGIGWPGLTATDLYELTMLHAYREAGMEGRAAFEFFFRKLPAERNFLLAGGLATLLDRLEAARFSDEELDWLAASGRFPAKALEAFAGWRFTGDVFAVPEGTPMFPEEPLVRIEAPVAQAQLVETFVINTLHFQTAIASKAARMVLAAPGKALVDFGLRRAHSLEAGILAARAAWIAGFAGTATVAAGSLFGIPLYGTMAHSFVQAHENEAEAFRHFAQAWPDGTTLLIDTYDTEAAARKVVALADELQAHGIRLGGVRIDSGDLAAHAVAVRQILDEGGLAAMHIVASGGIDEHVLLRLAQAPIDSFGIGTSLTTSQDAPALDCAYKLVAYEGLPRRKRSEGKVLWPGAKQVFRHFAPDGALERDVLACADEELEGEPLLQPVMLGGERLRGDTLEAVRDRASASLARLPGPLRRLDRAPPYPVAVSERLRDLARSLDAQGR